MEARTENIKISRLRANTGQIPGLPKNPRIQSGEQLERMKASIKENPEMLALRELLVFPSGDEFVVIGGNMRLRALRELGYKEAPCKVIDKDTPAETLKAYTIKDNASFGDWDVQLLADEWNEEDLNKWGLDITFEPEVEKPELGVEDVQEDGEVKEEGIPERVQDGDVWALGDHRLVCGDSLKAETYDKLLNGKKADLVFTDPPYGMKKEAEGVANDNLNFDDLLEFNKEWIARATENAKDNASFYCWGMDEPLMDLYHEILRPLKKAKKITFRNLLTWDKGNGQGQKEETLRMYPTADEKCLFWVMGQQNYGRDTSTWFEGFEKFRAYMDEQTKKAGLTRAEVESVTSSYASHYYSKSQYAFPTEKDYNKIREYARKRHPETFTAEYETIKAEYETIKAEWYATRAYFDNMHDNMNNVWHFDRSAGSERELTGGHATPKPVKLCARAIKTSSRQGEAVLDCFGGSGSTLIACEQLGRRCYMVELSPHYCDVIINRWQTITGKEARKL